jgi:hypothetical protein
MSYDFFVFPAERAEGLEEALAVYERTAERGTLHPDSAVARFVTELNTEVPVQSEGGFLSVRVDGTDEGSYVCTSWDDPMGNLRRVAGLARPHELAVLDVQLGALYDPRRSLDVALQTEAGPQLPYVTRAVLSQVLRDIQDGRYHWVNLARDGEHYAQTFHDDDGTWAVEHREGGPDQHFAARTPDATLVDDLLWSWARDDGRWRALLEFSPIEL